MTGAYTPHQAGNKLFESGIKSVVPLDFDEILAELEQLDGPLENWPEDKLRRTAELKVVLDKRKKDYGILYYKPYNALLIDGGRRVKDEAGNNVLSGKYPQEDFHKSMKKVRLALGGNQSGKTQTGAAESLKLSLGIHPYRQMRVPNKGRIVGGDLAKGIGEVIWPKYESMLPRSEVSSERRYSSGEIKKIGFRNGSTVEFLSYEQGTKLFEGWTGDWVWFDEPPPRDIFTACYRGLMRYGGIIFITATPLTEAWIYDELFLKAGLGPDQPDVFVLPTRGNPYLSDAEVELYAATVPEDERPARLDGVFKHLAGLVYKEFGMVHRIQSFPIPKDWTRLMVQDFHPRTPCAFLWAAVDPQGTLYFYDELKIDSTIPKIAEVLKLKEKLEYGRAVQHRGIDSLAATPDRNTGKSALKEFRTQGELLKWPLSFRCTTKNHALGFKAVHEYLTLKNGKPGCYFFDDKVPNTISAMLHYQWADFTGEKNIDKTMGGVHAHFADDVRYICVQRPTYRRSRPEGSVQPDDHKPDPITGY